MSDFAKTDFEYDYQRFSEIIKLLLKSAWIDHDDELEIGEDVSDQSEVKIIFDGYGDLEDEDEDGEYRYTEGGNRNMQSFAIFIHNDALTEGFVFPPHNTYSFTFGRMIQHRPDEEVCIFAWYDVENDDWDIIPLEDRLSEDNSMDAEDVMRILEGLHQKYFV
jgi:hypothetical protein